MAQSSTIESLLIHRLYCAMYSSLCWCVDAGAIKVVKPAQKPWGQIVSYVRDNRGFLVEICNPING